MQENRTKNCWHRCCWTRCQHRQQTDMWTAHCVILKSKKTSRYLDACHMAPKLGSDKCNVLSAFHAITGYDTTSGFSERGKRAAWPVWNKFNDVSPTVCSLAQTPTAAHIDDIIPIIERFVILMTVWTRPGKLCLSQKGGEMENIPPTKDAPCQHVIRAVYQDGDVWDQALLKAPQLPSCEEFVWKRENVSARWKDKMTNLPPAGPACGALVKCVCVKGCRRRCKYVKENLPRVLLCVCGGCQPYE